MVQVAFVLCQGTTNVLVWISSQAPGQRSFLPDVKSGRLRRGGRPHVRGQRRLVIGVASCFSRIRGGRGTPQLISVASFVLSHSMGGRTPHRAVNVQQSAPLSLLDFGLVCGSDVDLRLAFALCQSTTRAGFYLRCRAGCACRAIPPPAGWIPAGRPPILA